MTPFFAAVALIVLMVFTRSAVFGCAAAIVFMVLESLGVIEAWAWYHALGLGFVMAMFIPSRVSDD